MYIPENRIVYPDDHLYAFYPYSKLFWFYLGVIRVYILQIVLLI